MGLLSRCGSESCCDLLEYQNPSVYGTASTAPSTPRRPRGRHRGWLWSASKTGRWAGGPAGRQPRGSPPPPKRAPYPGASLDDRAGKRPPTHTPTKGREERGPRPPNCPLLSLPLRSALKGGRVLMDPKPPTGPLVPPSFVTAASASTSRPPPLPPTLARAPAG